MRLIKTILQRLRTLFKSKNYSIEYREEIPNVLNAKVLYLLGDKNEPWSASMICPCGCKEIIQLSLLPMDKPSLKVSKDKYGNISLQSSVWRTKGCRSYFFFTCNEIHWCK